MKFTKSKLREAEFFLDKMKTTRGEEEFQFYLDAFVPAARAITKFLDSEYRYSEYGWAFEKWYGLEISEKDSTDWPAGSARARMAENEICNFFYKLRNVVLKDQPPSSRDVVYLKADEGESASLSVTTFEGEEKRISTTSSSYIQVVREEPDRPPIQHADLAKSGSGGEMQVRHHFSKTDEMDFPFPEILNEITICEAAELYLTFLNELIAEWFNYVQGEYDIRRLLRELED